MIEEQKNSGFRIVIPISGMEGLVKYQKGLMGVLNNVEVGNCDPTLKKISSMSMNFCRIWY